MHSQCPSGKCLKLVLALFHLKQEKILGERLSLNEDRWTNMFLFVRTDVSSVCHCHHSQWIQDRDLNFTNFCELHTCYRWSQNFPSILPWLSSYSSEVLFKVSNHSLGTSNPHLTLFSCLSPFPTGGINSNVPWLFRTTYSTISWKIPTYISEIISFSSTDTLSWGEIGKGLLLLLLLKGIDIGE